MCFQGKQEEKWHTELELKTTGVRVITVVIGWLQVKVSVSRTCTWSFHPLGRPEFFKNI